jgi:hypothetical protein
MTCRIPQSLGAERRKLGQGINVIRKRPILVIALLATCGIVVGLASFAFHIVAVSLAAENTHHAYRTTLAAVASYVGDRGRWPQKWDELQPFLKSVDSDPERLAAVSSRVHVDFTLTLKDVAGMAPDTFSAIEPIGPNYGKQENDVSQLLDVVRSHLPRKPR